MSNEFDAAVDAAMQTNPAQAARYGFVAAADTNPDSYAEAQRVARRNGVPVDTVLALPKEMKRQDKVGSIDFDTLAKTSPATAALLADVEKAKIAHDDVDNLSGIESAASFLKTSAIAGFNDFLGAGAKLGSELLPGQMTDAEAATLYKNKPNKLAWMRENHPALWLAGFARGRTEASKQNMLEMPEGAQQRYGNLKYATTDPGQAAYLSPVKLIGDAIRSLPTTAALALTAYLTRGASVRAEEAALAAGATAEVAKAAGIKAAVSMASRFGAVSEGAVGYAQQALQTQNEIEGMPIDKLAASPAFQDLVTKGYDQNAARIFLAARAGEQAGVGAGFVDAITNAYGGKLLGRIIGEGGSLLPRVLKGFGNEAGVEFVQSGGEQLFQNLATKENAYPTVDLSKDVLENAMQGLFVGGVTGGSFSGVFGRSHQAEQAAQSAELLATLNKLAEASKVRERDPATAQAFFQSILDEGRDAVYITPDALAQSGLAERMAQSIPAVAEQLASAAESLHDIRIPIADLLTTMAGPELEQSILPHVATEPGGFTPTTAQEYLQSGAAQELQAEIEKAAQLKTGDDAWRASVAAVRTTIEGELNAAGRFSPDVNHPYALLAASFYATKAAQLGITPEEMYQRYPLRALAESSGGAQFDQRPFPVEKTVEFGEFKTGQPVTFDFIHNTESATALFGKPAKDAPFDRGIEPSGRYVNQVPNAADVDTSGRMIAGTLTFKNPLVLDADTWKQTIFDHYKKRGKNLSEALIRDGYDGVVTITHDARPGRSHTSEILDLTTFDKSKALYQGQNGSLTGQNEPPYHRFTNSEADTGTGYMMFSENPERVSHYGKNHFTFDPADIQQESVVYAGSQKFKTLLIDALNQHPDLLSEYQSTAEQLAEEANPSNIVDSAGIWDAPDIVDVIIQDVLEPNGWLAVETEDGAIVFDSGSVRVGHDHQQSALPENITVDGTDRPTTNSKGQPIHPTEEGVRNFYKWFGDSKVVDEQGRPLVVYHGTAKDFTEFDLSRTGESTGNTGFYGAGAYFSQDGEDAGGYALWARRSEDDAANVISVYLALQNPLYLHINPKDDARRDRGRVSLNMIVDQLVSEGYFGKNPDKNEAGSLYARLTSFLEKADFERFMGTLYNELKGGEAVSDLARRAGFDGVMAEGFKKGENFLAEVVAFSPEQIKSAIGNAGQFSPHDANILEQGARGSFNPETLAITLNKGADLSTTLHEMGHFFLEVQADVAAQLQQEATIHGIDALQPGERQILADMQTTLDWFGLQDVNQWFALSFEEKRAYHEQFARGFEAYLFDGAAPSVALQGVFQRFRAWLLNVYRSLKALNVELNDDMRAVFDRMVATTDQIQLAEQGRSMMPLFASAAQIGMTPQEFADYQALGTDASNEAIQELQGRALRDMQWLRNTRARAIKRLQKEAAGLRAEVQMEVRREVMSQPVYRAWQFLTGKMQKNETADSAQYGKLSLSGLAEIGLPPEIVDHLKTLRMTAKDGLHPDLVAELFGFTSGDEMVRTLAAIEAPRTEIENRTDRLMLERHGDLSSPQAIEQAADKAVHNAVRARFVAAEANALARATGKPQTLTAAAREYAAAVISRIKVRHLAPGQYASAEVRAAKSAKSASEKGDLATAAAEKRNQLINLHLTRAAYDAQEAVAKALEYFKRVQKPGTIPAAHHEQIMALLAKFDLRVSTTLKTIDNAARFRTWAKSEIDKGNIPPNAELLLSPQQRVAYEREVQRTNEDGELIYPHEEDQALLLAGFIDEMPVRSYKEATVEEILGLRDAIKQIEHIGRRTKKVLTDRKRREFAAVVEEMRARIVEVAEKRGRRATDTITPNDKAGARWLTWRGFFFSHIKTANLLHIMDGGDGGPLMEHLMLTANEAGNGEVEEIAKAHDAIKALLEPVKALGDITDKPRHFPTIGMALNRQARIVMALNMGNESNEQRLLGGYGWQREQIQPVLDTLTAADWAFVQGLWDHYESYRARVGAMEALINGVEPKWVEARPFTVTTADGQTLNLRGGYAPVIYDPRASGKAASYAAEKDAKAMMQAARVASTVQKSFTKARVEEVKGRPLLLSLDAMIGGVQDTIHYLHWQPWIIDANRLVRALDAPIREYYGAEVVKQLRDWTGDNAAGMRPARDGAERAVTNLARNVSFAGLAFNVWSAAQQITGLTQSVAVVGGGWMGRGLAHTLAHPIDSYRTALEKSSFMRKRASTRMRDLAEVNATVQDQGAVRTVMDKSGYSMMLAMQTAVDLPTWWAGYEKAIDAGHDEHKAVLMADQAIVDSQGGGLQKDLASIERATGAIRLLTGFMSFMNTTANVNYRVLKSDASIASKAVDLVIVNALPVMLTILLKAALTPGDSGLDDEKKLGRKYFAEQINYLFGQFIGFREIAQLGTAFLGEPGGDYGGSVGLRLAGDILKLAKQVGQGQIDDALRKAVINAAGTVFRLPSAQINRTITGAEALHEGKTSNPAALAFGFQEKR